MSRIEELPDDHDETSFTPKPTNPSLPNATKLISSPTSADTPISVPPLPPILSADDPSKKTVDEVAADLKKSPFFMTSTDEAADPDNIELEAMRALMYEGTRLEIAIGFREQGTEMAKAKKWADAKEFYYKALLALRVERKEGEAWTEGVGSKEEEEAKERGCKEICLVNRALCHMELRNYRSCTLDCTAALALNPSNLKAHYRLTSALLSLSHLVDARTALNAALLIHPDATALLALQQRLTAAETAANTLAQKKAAEITRRQAVIKTLASALALRKIHTRNTTKPPDLEDASIKLVPDALDLKSSTLVFPTLILYPLHSQSDFVKAFGEEQTLVGHLEYLLPLPWDSQGEYKLTGGKTEEVEAYMETKSGGLVKWGKRVPLLQVLSGGKVEVVDGVVRVSVVPARRSQEYIGVVKARRGKV